LVRQESVTGSGNSLTVTARASADLVGVETAWYAVRASAGAGTSGYGITPLSAERKVQGRAEPRSGGPEVNFFEGAGSGFYRLLYKGDGTEVVVTARTRAGLEADPETCGKPGGANCIMVPRFVPVNPYVAVQVNGEEVRVPVGSSLRAVVRAGGRLVEEVMGTLVITKPFGGRQVTMEFDRSKQDVMSLVLLGNETVRW
jgi:hypothetical protein